MALHVRCGVDFNPVGNGSVMVVSLSFFFIGTYNSFIWLGIRFGVRLFIHSFGICVRYMVGVR